MEKGKKYYAFYSYNHLYIVDKASPYCIEEFPSYIAEDISKNEDFDIEWVEVANLADFDYIFDNSDDLICREDVKIIDFGQLTKEEIEEFLFYKMTSNNNYYYEYNGYVVLNICTKDTLIAIFKDGHLSIKSAKPFIKLDYNFEMSLLPNLEYIDFSNIFVKSKNYDWFFSGCCSLQNLDLTHFDFSSTYSMKYMFDGCDSLKYVRFNKDANYTKLQYIDGLFNGCNSIEDIDISMFDLSKCDDSRKVELSYIQLISDMNLRRYKSSDIELQFK